MKTTIDDLHKVNLLLLDEFIRVCDKHNLQWFADSGTLLGAIRHGEIIPWDDDIDVIMPRKDFNKLLEIAKTEFKAPFFFQSSETDNYWCTVCKLRYSNSTYLEIDKRTNNQYDCKFNNGIFIDIFVFDAVPENDDEFTSIEHFLRYLFTFADTINYNFTTEKTIRIEAFKVLNNLLTYNSEKYNNSKYVANLLANKQRKYMHKKILRSSYSSYFEIDFKGLNHKLRIPVGYEDILECWYDKDWKIEKQDNSNHLLGFFDTSISYTEYKKLSFEDYMKLFTFN